MNTQRFLISVISVGLLFTAQVGAEEDHGSIKGDLKDAGKRTGKTIKEAAKTGGGAVRDSAVTVGRTVKSQVDDGKGAAKKTWKKNAAMTKENAREGGRKTKAAAKSE